MWPFRSKTIQQPKPTTATRNEATAKAIGRSARSAAISTLLKINAERRLVGALSEMSALSFCLKAALHDSSDLRADLEAIIEDLDSSIESITKDSHVPRTAASDRSAEAGG